MRTMTQVAGIGLATAVASVTIALLQAPSSPEEAEWAASGLAQIDVPARDCDPSLPEGAAPAALQERLRTVTPTFMPCLSGTESPPSETLRLRLTVDCAGRLADLQVMQAGDWSDGVVACTQSVLAQARFPAEGPASYTFDLPVRYTAD